MEKQAANIKKTFRLSIKYSLRLYLLLLSMSCKDYKIVDLSNKIEFPTITCNNNDIDFFIQEITLVNVEERPNLWIEGLPAVTLNIQIRNKSDTTFYINLWDTNFQSDIVGITKTTKDTVFFITGFDSEVFINSKDSCVIEVSAGCSNFPSFNYDKDYIEGGDNTEMVLSLIRGMAFYYIPTRKDTLRNNDNCCIGISPKTKIISHSIIR